MKQGKQATGRVESFPLSAKHRLSVTFALEVVNMDVSRTA